MLRVALAQNLLEKSNIASVPSERHFEGGIWRYTMRMGIFGADLESHARVHGKSLCHKSREFAAEPQQQRA